MTGLTSIKAISFDVDGTLWDFEGVMRHSLHRALLELERAAPEASAMLDVDRMIAIRDRVHDELRGKVWDLNEIRLESFRHALREAGRPTGVLASRLSRFYFEHRDAGRRPFADALPALRVLRGTYRLGVLSNGNTSPEDLGLGGMFDFTVLAQDHGGGEKPDQRIFEIALDSTGCAAPELVHVGDSLENDVAGARAAGVVSVWLNRARRERDAAIEADWEIRSLEGLEGILCAGA